MRQTEQYFVVELQAAAHALPADVREAHAAEGILTSRWWSPAEIAGAAEPVFPGDLVARLAALGGRPAS